MRVLKNIASQLHIYLLWLFAAALLATVPVIILFMCIEKHLAAGLTAGGVKG